MNAKDMLKGNPGKSLFFFALPMILGNLFQQFYNMADSIVVGRFVGEEALAAVGASYSFTTVFIMVAIGGGIGASVLTSQYLGAGQYGKMRTSIYTALTAFLGISILLSVLGLFFNPAILTGLRTPKNVMVQAVLYLNIYFVGLPFLFMYNIISSVFNALGKSHVPLYFLLFSSVLNIGLDLYMVIVLGMGVAGVAVATVVAQGVSAAASFLLLKKTLRHYPQEPQTEGKRFPAPPQADENGSCVWPPENGRAVRPSFRRFDPCLLGKAAKIAIPSIIQQSIVSIGMLLVQSVVNSFGSSVLAGYSAGMRVESLCIVPMIATGNAVSTFTAQNLGARQPQRVREGYRFGCLMVLGFEAVICLTLNLFHRSIASSFLQGTAGGAAYETANSYMTFLSWFFVLIGLKSATDGVLRGAGDVGVYMAANLANLSIRVLVANLCAPIWGVRAVWYAVPMGWSVNFLLSFLWFLTGRWSRKKLVS
ncbi:MAG: MATE family efflux transporter [Clostridium sp.]|jgi:Na+-driven multidrug efflux pump|nr:MATE family efflux transporter [Clostridium sp.]